MKMGTAAVTATSYHTKQVGREKKKSKQLLKNEIEKYAWHSDDDDDDDDGYKTYKWK